MQRMITLNEAAEELSMFYGDLVELLSAAKLLDPDYAHPNTKIEYQDIEILREEYKEHIPPSSVKEWKFNPLRWSQEYEIKQKYNLWFDNWVKNHRAEYAAKHASFQNYLKKKAS